MYLYIFSDSAERKPGSERVCGGTGNVQREHFLLDNTAFFTDLKEERAILDRWLIFELSNQTNTVVPSVPLDKNSAFQFHGHNNDRNNWSSCGLWVDGLWRE